MMNIALWVVQILLAVAFAGAGFMKVSQPLENLSKRMGWVNSVGERGVRTIGILEILGAIGLILPVAFRVLPWLTPIAAIGLVLTMIGAAILHIRRNEISSVAPTIVLLLLAAFIVWGRFAMGPLS
jgi:uncharacterized membrane protein YphA (DoxX/SURF4 family)